MLDRKTAVAAFAALMLGVSGVAIRPALAQTGKAPGEKESSSMAPSSGNTGAANNGVGTSGSLDHDAGKASSTVAGVNGGKTGFGGGNSLAGAGGKIEGDPAQGGGNQPKDAPAPQR